MHLRRTPRSIRKVEPCFARFARRFGSSQTIFTSSDNIAVDRPVYNKLYVQSEPALRFPNYPANSFFSSIT